jgi:hypothetical protein
MIAGGIQQGASNRRIQRLLNEEGYQTSVRDGRVYAQYEVYDEAAGMWVTQESALPGDTVGRWLGEGRSASDIRTAISDDDVRGSFLSFAEADRARAQVYIEEDYPYAAGSPEAQAAEQSRLLQTGSRVLDYVTGGVEQLGAFAERNPGLAEMGIGVAQVALGGPTRGIVHRVVETAVGEGVSRAEDWMGRQVSGALQQHLGMEAGLSDLLGSTGVFGMSAILGAGGGTLVHKAMAIRREAIDLGDRRVLFGQRRLDARFSSKPEVPAWLRNQNVADIAQQLRANPRLADQIRIEVFEHNGELVSMNTRGLAALSEAGLRPTNVVLNRNPPRSVLNRLREQTLVGNRGPLPSHSSVVTVSRTDLTPVPHPQTGQPWIVTVP